MRRHLGLDLRLWMPWATALILASFVGTASANRHTMWWNFDSGDISTTSGVGTLNYLDDGFGTTAALTVFGTTASGGTPLPGIPDLPNGPSGVMKFPGALGALNGYRVDFNLPDRDGPTAGYLDSYTLMMDIYIDDAPIDGYVGIHNSNEAHENNAEVWLDFVSSTGGFWDSGSDNVGDDTFALDTWHRIALVVRDSATLDIFVDGTKVADDAYWDDNGSLYTTTSPDPDFGGASFSILGSGDQYHGEGYVSSVAFADMPLTDAEVAALGGAKAGGLVLPVLGDANGDRNVTGADFTVWADNFGLTSGGTPATGDFNGDGMVTGADFTIWADCFGSNGTSPSSVPEPGSLALIVVGLLVCLVVRRVR